jgi:hypothetical protein
MKKRKKLETNAPPIGDSLLTLREAGGQKSVRAVTLLKKARKRTKYHPPPQSLKNLKTWPKGASGNPSDLPECDRAAVIARCVLRKMSKLLSRVG